MTTFAGNTAGGCRRDGTAARFNQPRSITTDGRTCTWLTATTRFARSAGGSGHDGGGRVLRGERSHGCERDGGPVLGPLGHHQRRKFLHRAGHEQRHSKDDPTTTTIAGCRLRRARRQCDGTIARSLSARARDGLFSMSPTAAVSRFGGQYDGAYGVTTLLGSAYEWEYRRERRSIYPPSSATVVGGHLCQRHGGLRERRI